ncbi:MAG TPA: hypothetical protein VHM88_16530 [Candidatus Acidoferrales bacterium]|nr:hypothetical protein [Candidatus Acidoferrales bacterium]
MAYSSTDPNGGDPGSPVTSEAGSARSATKRIGFIVPVVLLALIGGYWWLHSHRRALPEAYVSERGATLWSTLAQVRQPVAALRYGERIGVLEHRGDQVYVRTAEGSQGWVEGRALMDPALWLRRAQLLEQARALPAQALGRTGRVCNVHLEPGRGALRVYQFARGAPVEMVARAVAEWTQAGGEEEKPRSEDWLLVRGFTSSDEGPAGSEGEAAKAEPQVPVAGWVLARFIEFNVPNAVRDYASSAGMRVVAWFELNRVQDPSGEKPQYLVAGYRGGEGQPCDFTMIRVYTWGSQRQRYETAYVESNLCGRLPIRMGKTAAGDPEFRFAAEGKTGREGRRYFMRQTIVRRVREGEPPSAHRRH